MKVIIRALGRLKSPALQDLITIYQERLTGKLTFEEYEVKKKLAGDTLKEAEADLLLQKLPADGFVIALDERGKSLTSPEFARLLSQKCIQGTGTFVFLIGGAEGLSPRVEERADFKLSLGPMTWPHMLVRLLLTEQLYRAQQILTGHPYHKD